MLSNLKYYGRARTRSPNFTPAALEIFIKKQPSPSINPANKKGSGIKTLFAWGLITGIISEGASSPFFIDQINLYSLML